jgi:hypothetical protein
LIESDHEKYLSHDRYDIQSSTSKSNGINDPRGPEKYDGILEVLAF